MPLDDRPWWATPQARRPAPPRALDPATGRPFRKLNFYQATLLNLMKKLFDFFNEHFLIRRLAAAIVGAVTAINAAQVAPAITPEQTATLISVIGAGTAFVFECLQKWARLKFIKPAQAPRL